MLAVHTIFTLNSRYEALVTNGHVLSVRQSHGTDLHGVTGEGWLPLAGKATLPAIGARWTFVPIGVPPVTTSAVQFVEASQADVVVDHYVPRPRVALTRHALL